MPNDIHLARSIMHLTIHRIIDFITFKIDYPVILSQLSFKFTDERSNDALKITI